MTKVTILLRFRQKVAYLQAGIWSRTRFRASLGEIGAKKDHFCTVLSTFTHFYAVLRHFCPIPGFPEASGPDSRQKVTILGFLARFLTKGDDSGLSGPIPGFQGFQRRRFPAQRRFPDHREARHRLRLPCLSRAAAPGVRWCTREEVVYPGGTTPALLYTTLPYPALVHPAVLHLPM